MNPCIYILYINCHLFYRISYNENSKEDNELTKDLQFYQNLQPIDMSKYVTHTNTSCSTIIVQIPTGI